MIPYTLLEFEELTSTNDFLKENQTYFPHFTWIRTDVQTQGRGQYDRTWQSNKGENLLFSVLLKQVHANDFDAMKRWIMDTMIDVLQSYGVSPHFKEPNDLYVNDQKICGILIESISMEHVFDVVVIGIGLNVNQMSFHGLNATSIKQQTGQRAHLHDLFILIVEAMAKAYPRYL
jgi:biotin-[acetyl-CoA-carboxylase] ligase BirA-like protein